MGPIWDAELRVWDAKNFGLVSPGTHRNKFVNKSLLVTLLIQSSWLPLKLSDQDPDCFQLELILKTHAYEGCSNMNASSFITFLTHILRQNGICYYKGLYVTFKLAPDLKKNTVSLSSLNEFE